MYYKNKVDKIEEEGLHLNTERVEKARVRVADGVAFLLGIVSDGEEKKTH